MKYVFTTLLIVGVIPSAMAQAHRPPGLRQRVSGCSLTQRTSRLLTSN